MIKICRFMSMYVTALTFMFASFASIIYCMGKSLITSHFVWWMPIAVIAFVMSHGIALTMCGVE